MIAWIVAIAALYGLSSGLSGVTNDQASAYLPASAASTKVALLQQAAAQAASALESTVTRLMAEAGLNCGT